MRVSNPSPGGGSSSAVTAALRPPDLATPPTVWLRADFARAAGNGNTPALWPDGSGRGNHANPNGTSPLYIADGGAAFANKPVIRFSGGAIMQTAASASVPATGHTGYMVLKTASFGNTQQTLAGFLSAGFFFLQSAGGGSCNVGLYEASFNGYMWFPVGTPVIFSWVSSASGLSFWVNGQNLYDGNTSTPFIIGGAGPATGQTGSITTLALMNNQFNQANPGDLAEAIVYPVAHTQAERDGVTAYLSARYGIPVVNNFAIPKRCVLFGDSRSSPSGGLSAPGSCTFSSLRNALGLGWLVLTEGASGDTPANMDTRAVGALYPHYDSGLTKAVAIVWGGANGINTSTAAATLYASLLSCCAKARAAGYSVVLCTEVKNTGYDAPKETIRLALNVLIRGTSVPGTVDAICDLDAVLAAGQPLHPSAASGVLLANAMAASVLSV